MSPEEARMLLSMQEEDDLDEVYEQRVFEMQNFFLKQVPFSKVYVSKIQRMEGSHAAYLSLDGIVEKHEFPAPNLSFESTSPLEVLHCYQRNLAGIRSSIMRARYFPELISLSELLLENMHWYASNLAFDSGLTDKVKASQAGDEMEILTELRRLEAQGNSFGKDFSALDENNCVRKEANRLSLWLKMEQDERAV